MVTTFRELWAGVENRYGDHPVVVSAEDGSRFSYGDVDILLSATIGYLHDLGLRQNDTIVIHADNNPEYLFMVWAALQLGVIVAPIDFSAPVSTVQAIIDEVAPSLICCDKERLSRFGGSSTRIVIFDPQQPGDDFYDERLFSSQISEFIDGPGPLLPQLHGKEPAVILYTSGSSGRPKGVILHQESLCRSGALMAQTYGWGGDDVLLSLGAMHVMSGLRNPATAALASGTTVLVATAPQRTLIPATVELCHRYAVTIISAVPPFLHGLLSEQQRWRPRQLNGVRLVLVTGASIDHQSAQKVSTMIHAAVLSYYGLTETCGFCIHVPVQCPQQSSGVLGREIGAEAEVVDEQGRVVEDQQTGELRIRSASLMLGYLAQPESTAKVLRGGWLYTGDLVQRRTDGLLYFLGRRDDRVKSRSGDIVYPEEIGLSLQQHGDVVSAAVCGVEIPQQQQELIAFVVVKETDKGEALLRAELRDWLLMQLGTRGIPARILFYETLPKGSSGKINCRNLVQEYLSEQSER